MRRDTLAAIAMVYALGAGVATQATSDYRVMLATQTFTVTLLLMLLRKFPSTPISHTITVFVTAALAASLVARTTALAVTEVTDRVDINRAAKLARWDAFATATGYSFVLGRFFQALVPRGLPYRFLWQVAVVAIAVRSAVVLSSTAISPARPDASRLALTARESYAVYDTHPIHDTATDTRASVRVVDGVTLVAFAGTYSIKNMLTNTRVADTHPEWADCVHPKLRVHAGFAAAWASVRTAVLNAVTYAGPDTLVLTGHSMGGALACLAALDLKCIFPDLRVEVYSFGSPQVGDQLFVDAFDARIDHSVRVINPLDPVPRSLSTQFPHVGGAYVVAAITKDVSGHTITSYETAVRRGRRWTMVSTAVPLIVASGGFLIAYLRAKKSGKF